MQKTRVQSLGWEDPWRGEGLPTPVFWPGGFHGVYSPWGRRVGHDWVTFTHTHVPGSSAGKESHPQCRRPRFNSGVRKIPFCLLHKILSGDKTNSYARPSGHQGTWGLWTGQMCVYSPKHKHTSVYMYMEREGEGGCESPGDHATHVTFMDAIAVDHYTVSSSGFLVNWLHNSNSYTSF